MVLLASFQSMNILVRRKEQEIEIYANALLGSANKFQYYRSVLLAYSSERSYRSVYFQNQIWYQIHLMSFRVLVISPIAVQLCSLQTWSRKIGTYGRSKVCMSILKERCCKIATILHPYQRQTKQIEIRTAHNIRS